MKKLIAMLVLVLLIAAPVCHASGLEWITVAENAVLPDAAQIEAFYPASVTLGQQVYDLPYLLNTLLGEGYYLTERSEYDYADEYRSAEGEEPWEYRTVRIYDEEWARTLGASFSYSNPWVTGERGGEYEAPSMNMLPDESLFLCRSLLNGVVPTEWLDHVNESRWICDRWAYSDRWMTDEEYKTFCYERKNHYITFDHLTDAGLPIQGDMVFANVGVDGLSFVDVSWREYTESAELTSPLSLEEALTMANSTREAPCTLLCARLVYSSWLTEDDTCNLSWQLFTDAGTYIVDCVQKKHMCDSYEY